MGGQGARRGNRIDRPANTLLWSATSSQTQRPSTVVSDSNKAFPKDIDVLVTVIVDCELAPLAKLGRQLSGHMNNYRAGADVFLASEDGHYLGRTCPWRDCGPPVPA